MHRNPSIRFFIALTLFAPALAHAQTPAGAAAEQHQHAAHGAPAMTQGEVRKVDKAAGKVTIKHGAIPNLEMEPMTMVFRVKDPAMLNQLKEGDRINFEADKIGGLLTLTRVESAR